MTDGFWTGSEEGSLWGDIPLEEFDPEEEALPPAETEAETPEEEPEEEPAYDPEDFEPAEGEDEPGSRGLLNRKGRLREVFWSDRDELVYNKEYLRMAARRKEWELYRLCNSRFCFEVLYGHIAAVGFARVALTDMATGETVKTQKLRPFPNDSMDLDFSGGQPHTVKYEDKDLYLSINNDGQTRRIRVRSDRFEADISCHDGGDAIVTTIPFRLRREFLYDYKKVFPDLAGKIQMYRNNMVMDGETFMVLRSTRAVLPYTHEWIWCAGATETTGDLIALNLGEGPGRDGTPTDNALFVNGRLQKLGEVRFRFAREDLMKPWRITDDAGRLRLTFRPVLDHAEKVNVLLAHVRIHQVYGRLSGTVVSDDGQTYTIEDIPFFCERAVNRW